MVNQGPHFTNNKRRVVVCWGAPHMLCKPGKAQAGLSASRTLLGWLTSAESTREALVLSFNQWTKKCLIQSELHNYIYICIYADQSEQLYNDQSELHDANQLELSEFENFICIKLDQLGTWCGVTFSMKVASPLSQWSTWSFRWRLRLCFLALQTVVPEEVSLFLHVFGNFCWQGNDSWT